ATQLVLRHRRQSRQQLRQPLLGLHSERPDKGEGGFHLLVLDALPSRLLGSVRRARGSIYRSTGELQRRPDTIFALRGSTRKPSTSPQRKTQRGAPMTWLPWAPLAADSLHIFEEFAWPGGFADWYRRYKPGRAKSLTPRFLIIINGLLLVLCYDAGALRDRRY